MDITPIKTKVVGVDISINATTYAIVDLRGNIIAKDQFVTSDYDNVNNYVNVLTEKIIFLAEENGGLEHIRSVGVSSPSGNYVTGCIENSPNMPWKGVIPLGAMLRDRLGLAVAVGNDSALRTVAQDVGVVRAEGDDPELRLLHRRACCRFVEEEAARQRFAVCRGET